MEEVMKKLQEHDKRFDDHDKRFDAHDAQLDVIATTVLEHSERMRRLEEKLDGLATKKDIATVMTTLDTVVVLVKKKDQELTMLTHGLRRVSDDITNINTLVGLANG